MDSLTPLLQDGFRSAGIVFLLMISYKVYRCRVHTDGESSCVKCFRLHFTTDNPGGGDIENVLT